MIAKIFILFLGATAGTFIGLMFSNRFTRRRKFFEETVSLTNHLFSDLKFKQSMISEILSKEAVNYKSKLKNNMEEYIDYVKNGGELKLSRHDLNLREYDVLKEFFDSIGTLDLDTQIFVIENYKAKFSEFYAGCEKSEKSYGKAAVKLGFLAGLALGILLI